MILQVHDAYVPGIATPSVVFGGSDGDVHAVPGQRHDSKIVFSSLALHVKTQLRPTRAGDVVEHTQVARPCTSLVQLGRPDGDA